MPELTGEQRAAIESGGKTIVSASAGSGKTFVMIQKLVAEIENGTDMDNVLAVTFTKKAAAQMKEKLRSAVIERIKITDGEKRERLKTQLSKIPSASISTIHAFCARMLRTYFYAVDIDGTFDIIAAEDAVATELKSRVIEELFDRYYEEGNPQFLHLLKCFRKKRSDNSLKQLIIDCYENLRINADYEGLLSNLSTLYTEQGFKSVAEEYEHYAHTEYARLRDEVIHFAANFISPKANVYGQIFGEMIEALTECERLDIFTPRPKLSVTKKPVDPPDGVQAGEEYKAFRDELVKRYNAVLDGIESEEIEKECFLKSGETAMALAAVILEFDREYAATKRDENKLDYNDLEHLTLKLLKNPDIQREIKGRYTCVFVDEYQDVNPVQEEIISGIGADQLLLVGDVKQAIYGFRGSKSHFFSEKYTSFEGDSGTALRLSNNFRSSDGVLDFVNGLFSRIMTRDGCGIDYKSDGIMIRGGGYESGYGKSEIHVFGKDEKESEEICDVYSVCADGRDIKHSREGLAVLEIVERELKSKHYDLKSGEMVDTQPGDICILTRKRSSANVTGIVRTLTDAGYSVSGAQESNICNRPEVKEMLDILSYIDNPKQDIAMTTTMLTPIGGFSCDELAKIRIAFADIKGDKPSFVQCCLEYSAGKRDEIAKKLKTFYERTEYLRSIADIMPAADIIDIVLENSGLEGIYAAGGGEKLKSVRRLALEAGEDRLAAFLCKLKEGGYSISAPSSASSESIKIMTMHASKGLEFPVVILSDICATFKGRDYEEVPVDDVFALAPKYHDSENMLVRPTILRELIDLKEDYDELNCELNLFYVACTRAMCNLHIMAKEVKPYSPLAAGRAKSYSQLFDISKFPYEVMTLRPDFASNIGEERILANPDEEVKKLVEDRFMKDYFAQDSVNLPVKSSASALMKLNEEDEFYRPTPLFAEEGDTGAERGTAYHKFLELCDFSIKDESGIKGEIESFVESGKMQATQAELLELLNLVKILNMPVFEEVSGGKIMREQEFLCRISADKLFDTKAEDGVLVQGAIDLLSQKGESVYIVDYKYSNRDDEGLKNKYTKQLLLYAEAVKVILEPREIHAAIVNIKRQRQITLF